MSTTKRKKRNTQLSAKLKHIKLIIFDIDGTLTEGSVILDGETEFNIFSVRDGAAIKFLQWAGIEVAFMSGRTSRAAKQRAKDLEVSHIFQGAKYNKREVLERALKRLGLKAKEVAYVGDDLPDLQVLPHVGVGIAVGNAVREVKRVADYVCKASGGRGAAREVVELLLRAQGKWQAIVKKFSG